MNLDDRARQGAQEIHAAFAQTPIPAAPPARRVPRTMLIAGTLASATALVVGAFVVANRDDSREAQGTPPPPQAELPSTSSSTSSSSSSSTAGTSSPRTAVGMSAAFPHVGLAETVDGWDRLGAGSPTGSDEGDSDWESKLTVLETADGPVIGSSTPVDLESIGSDPASRLELIGGRSVYFSTEQTDDVALTAATWAEGPLRVSLWGTMSDVRLADIVPMTMLDSENYLVPTPASPLALGYRGDIAPWFAAASSQLTEAIPFDEVVGYRSDAAGGEPASLLVGVVRGRADGLALIESFGAIQGAIGSDLGLLGGSGFLGSIPPPADNDGFPAVEQFAALAVGDDLVVIVSSGLSADAFAELLANVGPVDDATWSRWITETPLDEAFAALAQANETAEAPSPTEAFPAPTDVQATAP